MTSINAFKQIAAQHGLNPIVPVETGTLLGEYEKEDHVDVKREVSHWDFVLYMCQNEGFVTRVGVKIGSLVLVKIFLTGIKNL